MRLSLGLLLILVLAHPAAAGSEAAQHLVDEQIAEACFGEPGTIRPESVAERDLTGDGHADLIIDHGGIACGEGGMSSFCGAQLCLVLIYVREGSLLVLKMEALSVGFRLSDGDTPTIGLFQRDGTPVTLAWDGTEFR